jgi:hypothetical protein
MLTQYTTAAYTAAMRAHPTAALAAIAHLHGGVVGHPTTGVGSSLRMPAARNPTGLLPPVLSRVLNAIFAADKRAQLSTSAGREKYAYDYLRRALHLSPTAAAALVGNLAHESSIGSREVVPGAHEIRGPGDIHGHGVGIAQWTNAYRQEALFKFATQMHKPWQDFDLELEYMVHELKSENQLYHARDGKAVYLVPDRHILEELRRLNRPQDLGQATALVEAGYLSPEPGSYGARLGEARDILTGRFG